MRMIPRNCISQPAYDTLLKPSLAVYYDFDEGNGAFLVASIGHSFEVAKRHKPQSRGVGKL